MDRHNMKKILGGGTRSANAVVKANAVTVFYIR